MEYVAASVTGAEVHASHLPDRIAAAAAPWMVGAGSRPPAPAPAETEPAPATFRNIYEEIEELERTRIRQALEHTGGVRVKAAQLIGMPLRTMLTKMKQYGLETIVARDSRSSRS
jgi:two-component system response regulator AtoC